MQGDIKRVLWIVMDSVGAGALPDAEAFGDAQSVNTLAHALAVPQVRVPTLDKLGLRFAMRQVGTLPPTAGAVGRAAEKAPGKDTTIGHWEMAGYIQPHAFPTYPEGFPRDIIDAFCRAIHREGVLGNVPASGTEIIAQLGKAHMQSGLPIVYTSGDSVFQIAAHEDIVPVDTLYEWCRKARAMLQGGHGVARVIARPFTGTPGAFVRTARRHDFSLAPGGETILDALTKRGVPVTGVGKIGDIFAQRGIAKSIPTTDNEDGMDRAIALCESGQEGLLFVNLVDFDTKYGHRRDVMGYAQALVRLDARMAQLLQVLDAQTLLCVTADHGCDPLAAGTDHTREYVPVLFDGAMVRRGVDLGTRATFADMGSTIYQALTGAHWPVGTSMYTDFVV
nr:phosphopentomutase [Maliibacterium massiliense]